METIEWAVFTYDTWNFYIAKNDQGLCYVSVPDESFDEFILYMEKKYPKTDVVENETALLPYKEELTNYFAGKISQFMMPVSWSGTEFQKLVWQALQKIPFGETCTYSDIAEKINRPKSVRAVGTAIGANPILIVVPCHRVIGKNGKLTGFRGGLEMKKKLLEIEEKR